MQAHAEARRKAAFYLQALATGITKGSAAGSAGVRLDHLPYWRKNLPGFKRREQIVVEELQAKRDVSRVLKCQCGKVLVGRKGQEFCSRSCAQREIKSAYWSPRDTEVLEALSAPLSRRELIEQTGLALGSLRPVLARLERRGMIEREGAPRGLYCKWKKVA